MQLGEPTDRFTWFIRLATFVLVVAILRVAQDVLIPVAFAALLAFLLSPLVVRLMRWKLPKTLAIIATVTLAFSVIGGIGCGSSPILAPGLRQPSRSRSRSPSTPAGTWCFIPGFSSW